MCLGTYTVLLKKKLKELRNILAKNKAEEARLGWVIKMINSQRIQ